MDFDTIAESGYYVRAHLIRRVKAGVVQFETCIRFHDGQKTTRLWWTASPRDRDLRKYIDCFPYINPNDDRLRIWDMEEGCNVMVSANGATLREEGNGSNAGYGETGMTRGEKNGRLLVDSFCANQVKRRWPRIHERIREMGYWKSS